MEKKELNLEELDKVTGGLIQPGSSGALRNRPLSVPNSFPGIGSAAEISPADPQDLLKESIKPKK